MGMGRARMSLSDSSSGTWTSKHDGSGRSSSFPPWRVESLSSLSISCRSSPNRSLSSSTVKSSKSAGAIGDTNSGGVLSRDPPPKVPSNEDAKWATASWRRRADDLSGCVMGFVPRTVEGRRRCVVASSRSSIRPMGSAMGGRASTLCFPVDCPMGGWASTLCLSVDCPMGLWVGSGTYWIVAGT